MNDLKVGTAVHPQMNRKKYD